MEKYKLLKDLPNAKAGEIFTLCQRELANGGDETVLVGEWCEFCDEEIEKFDILNPDKGWFEKIEEKKYGGRVPKAGDKFWLVCLDGSLSELEWVGDNVDEAFLECNGAVWFEAGSAFWTREEAEKEAKRRKAYVILKEDTKGFEPDWGHNSLGEYKGHSYGVYYCRPSGKPLVNQCGAHEVQDGIRFATEEDAKASIKAHEKEWRAWLGVEDE